MVFAGLRYAITCSLERLSFPSYQMRDFNVVTLTCVEDNLRYFIEIFSITIREDNNDYELQLTFDIVVISI